MKAVTAVYEPDDYGSGPCTIPTGPAITMTPAEANDLAAEIEEAYRAASYLETWYGLPALEEFHRRLCEAFDLHREPL